MRRMARFCPLLLLVACSMLLIAVATAADPTTQVTITRMSIDGITPTDTVATRTYQEMESDMDIQGDGNTFYYFQGPIFEGEWEANYGVSFPEYRTDWEGTPPDWLNSSEKWDRYWDGSSYLQNEETNWATKNLGKLKGTSVKDLCDLVGGVPAGQKIRVLAADNVYQDLPASAVNLPSTALGPYVITWWSVGAGESGATSGYTGPDYTNGMRATFFADDSRNPSGEHVAGLGDQAEHLPEEYWYYYAGQYPSMGGWTLKWVDRIYVYSNDLVPLPVADFSANIRAGHIVNGNFETGVLSPWTGSGATVSGYSYKKDSYSLRLLAPASGTAWIQQDVDFTGLGSINFWRHYFGGTGKFMEVYVGGTLVANYTDTGTVANNYQSIDLSSYGFSGTQTLRFRAVNTNPSGSFTLYLDEIFDYGPGTTGLAPLTVQFKDLTTKMQDTAHTSWSWDFNNDGITDSTVQNPLYTYSTTGTSTVKLTATNAGGSASEIKTNYIVATGASTIEIDAIGDKTNWAFVTGTNEDTSAVDLSVTAAGAWHVSVKDALNDGKPGATMGRLSEYTGSAYVTSGYHVLTNALQVNSGGSEYKTLSGSDQTIQTGSGNGNYNIGLKQEIAAGDQALTPPNVYRIVVTFTGAPN